jgi:hypothetical protein
MRRRLATLAPWLVILAVACATEVVPVRSEKLDWAGCSPAEQRAGARAFDRAAQLADTAAAAVEDPVLGARLRSNDWAAFRWWFGDFDEERFAAVRRTLHATGAEFERAFAMRCGAETSNCPPPQAESRALRHRSRDPDEYGPPFEGRQGALREWKEFAYANFGIPAVQLCPDFFGESRDAQAAILLHELTHVSSDTEDYAYPERYGRIPVAYRESAGEGEP